MRSTACIFQFTRFILLSVQRQCIVDRSYLILISQQSVVQKYLSQSKLQSIIIENKNLQNYYYILQKIVTQYLATIEVIALSCMYLDSQSIITNRYLGKARLAQRRSTIKSINIYNQNQSITRRGCSRLQHQYFNTCALKQQ